MKNFTKLGRNVVIIIAIVAICTSTTGCAWFTGQMKSIKGELVGNHFDIQFYDNNGENILNIDGKKVGLEANYVKTKSINSDGETETGYDMTSVVTITVDGHQVVQTGNTAVFVEDGIKKLEDFSLAQNIITDGGSINLVDRNLNKIKNVLGTPKVIVICSQLGTPIAVYGGSEVYWEIPSDLPKTTKLTIDGKALYVHRANYILIDSSLIKAE